jgi:3-deoxy-D-manno-octulosonic-acid transferase
LETLRSDIGTRKIWLAASTHPGEEEIALAAQQILRARHPDALLVIAPRHPQRGGAIAVLANGAPRRSKGDAIGGGDVYIFDTIGDLGTLFALAPVTLIGGSLSPTLTGHNPIEPAKIGSAVLAGPHVHSFADAYRDFFDAGAAREVHDAQSIAAAVDLLWADPSVRTAQTETASALVRDGGPALTRTIAALLALLDQDAGHAPA